MSAAKLQQKKINIKSVKIFNWRLTYFAGIVVHAVPRHARGVRRMHSSSIKRIMQKRKKKRPNIQFIFVSNCISALFIALFRTIAGTCDTCIFLAVVPRLNRLLCMHAYAVLIKDYQKWARASCLLLNDFFLPLSLHLLSCHGTSDQYDCASHRSSTYILFVNVDERCIIPMK